MLVSEVKAGPGRQVCSRPFVVLADTGAFGQGRVINITASGLFA